LSILQFISAFLPTGFSGGLSEGSIAFLAIARPDK